MAMALTNHNKKPGSPRSSPVLRPIKDSAESLKQAFHASAPTDLAVRTRGDSEVGSTSVVHTGMLQKRRRKRHQGYARRLFSLDFTSGTLSYYHDRNSSALRGAIPLSLAAIGANSATREISIDSGAEIWHLKANKQDDFDSWKKALQKASKNLADSLTPGIEGLQLDINGATTPGDATERDWVRIEALVSRISGTRDAVRRLCRDTDPSNPVSPAPAPDSTPSTPTEPGEGEYFKVDSDREKRPAFWKRKPSSAMNSALFKRSVSAQLAVPAPDLANHRSDLRSPRLPPEPRDSSQTRSMSQTRSRSQHSHSSHQEANIHEHIRSLLHDLDASLSEFSNLIAENKARRSTGPKTAASRLSIDTTGSQEFFDAEDGTSTPFLRIQNESDDEGAEHYQDADTMSCSSSDIDDEPNVFSSKRKRPRADSMMNIFPPKSKVLSPLPTDSVERRAIVSAPKVHPPSLISFLRKNVGKDLSTISMPVSANEPISLLQKAAENFEYTEILDKAAAATDAVERLIYVTAFAISSLSSSRAKERSIRKPFNPMLGETFELVREDKNFRFVSEKVSHRPVQLAFVAEGSAHGGWAMTQSPIPSQKFWGKSSEIVSDGKARIILYGCGEVYSFNNATAFLRNIIAGEKYVEPVGSMTIHNDTTHHKAVVSFKAKGMFSGRSEDVIVQAYDAHGAELPLGLEGTWTNELHLTEHSHKTSKSIWAAGHLVDQANKHYGMTTFAAALNEITSLEEGHLPPTDSRLRPDQRALEDGEYDQAEKFKHVLEEGQRERRRDMEEYGKEWQPRWFEKVELDGETLWKLKTGSHGYWEERAKGEWTGVVPVLKV